MKIVPPEFAIDPSNPFKYDLFGRADFGLSLENLVANTEDGLVIFINAPWGEGKTSFCRMWQAQLRKAGRDAIYFDAFASDYFEDPFVSVSGEIVAFLEDKYPDNKELQLRKKSFSENAINAAKKMASTGAKIALRMATLGAIEASHIDAIQEAGKELATGVGEAGEDFVKSRIEDYTKEKDALRTFKTELTKVAAAIKHEQGFPLTIIVDELDRCRPEFALKLLERIKHLFDVQNVVFVLLINREQVERYTNTLFGLTKSSGEYIQKFGHIITDLPNSESIKRNTEYLKFCELLSSHYQIPQDSRQLSFHVCIARVAVHFELSPRDVQRVYTIAAVYFASLPKGKFLNTLPVAILTIMKVKLPGIYKRLCNDAINYKDFLAETKLNELRNNDQFPAPEYLRNMLQFLLQEDDEYNSLPPDTQFQIATKARPALEGLMETPRRKIISSICRRLDMFMGVASTTSR